MKNTIMMKNKVVVITGSNAGLGFNTALHIARMGAHIVMACRSPDKANKARADILAQLPGTKITVLPLDLSELSSVQEFVQQFTAQIGALDLLINNAGIVAVPLGRNSAGQELQLATNYLGAFALTGMLLPLFNRDGQARIVNVGSLAHRTGKLNLEDFNWEKAPYDELKAYARSKLAMMSFTLELDRRLRKSGIPVIALSGHPGFAATDISRNSAALTPKSAIGKWLNSKIELLIPTPAQAARSIVHAACVEGVNGGDYFGPRGFLEIAGKPGKARINSVAKDIDTGKKLWAISETMTGVKYLSDL